MGNVPSALVDLVGLVIFEIMVPLKTIELISTLFNPFKLIYFVVTYVPALISFIATLLGLWFLFLTIPLTIDTAYILVFDFDSAK
jgi:hypothetical protein